MQDFDSAAEMKVIFKATHNKHLFLEMTLLHQHCPHQRTMGYTHDHCHRICALVCPEIKVLSFTTLFLNSRSTGICVETDFTGICRVPKQQHQTVPLALLSLQSTLLFIGTLVKLNLQTVFHPVSNSLPKTGRKTYDKAAEFCQVTQENIIQNSGFFFTCPSTILN